MGGDRQTEYMAACDRLCLDEAVCDAHMSERASLFMCRVGTLGERVRVCFPAVRCRLGEVLRGQSVLTESL